MGRIGKMIEIITNIAILLVCALLCWTVITHRSFSLDVFRHATTIRGTTLPSVSGYNWSSHKRTLVLAIRLDCRFCEQSFPFYKRLSVLRAAGNLHAHVLAVMPDDAVSGATTLKSVGITVEGVYGQPLASLKISGTPTLLLVDDHAHILEEWVGRLNAQGETEVISAAQM